MNRATAPVRGREGFSLVEVMVSMVLLALAMMSLAGVAALGLTQLAKARQDVSYSADVQQVADSLVGVGYNRVSNGTENVRGRSIWWTVSNVSPSSQTVDVIVQRRGQADPTRMYQDTVRLFLSKTQLQ
jgi:prepilin-type N-terminal cleavage/methylation domain-containing protein